MWKKRLKDNWRRVLVILLCIGLILAHSIWSQLKFDSINIWLGAIAIALFLFPKPDFLFPYMRRIKRFRAGDLEFELGELQQEVEKARESVAKNPNVEIPNNIPPEVEAILTEASKDPRAALLLLSSKIETTVRKRMEEAQIKYGAAIMRTPPTRRAIEIGIEKGLFPPSAISAYNDFMGLRNKIAHDYAFQVDNATILSLISLGTELLKVLSTEKSDGNH